MSFWLYILVSAAGGLLVGVIGTGSSLILLPSLVLIFSATLADSTSLRLAAGTTMATMAVGAFAGAIAQYRAGHVDVRLLRLTVLPYAIGALSGPWVSRVLPSRTLGIYVSATLCVVAIRMLFAKRTATAPSRDLLGHRHQVFAVLVLIGVGSSIAGVASGIFAIPYLSRFSLPVRTVIGTSTASAAVYAAFGTIGYVTAGWSEEGLPAGHVGFVYLPAFAIMAITASITTPVGVKLAALVDERMLRRVFGIFLFVAAAAIAFSG